MKAIVTIMLKDGVLDPQGKATRDTLDHLGFTGVADVRQGKVIELALPGVSDETKARALVTDMCEKLLANTVIESYRIDLAA